MAFICQSIFHWMFCIHYISAVGTDFWKLKIYTQGKAPVTQVPELKLKENKKNIRMIFS